MQIVLDTNIYLFALGAVRKASCERLLEKVASDPEKFEIHICRTILNEIRRKSSPQRLKDFWVILNELSVIPDEDWEVPFEIVARYTELGLKPGDAFIAGYAEYVGAECLITENRADFLSRSNMLPFKVASAETFLNKLT